jgi:hypothetical protein
MTKNSLIVAAAALLCASGIASAQTQTPPQYDSSGAPVPPALVTESPVAKSVTACQSEANCFAAL